MTPKQKRLAAIGGGLAFLALAAFIALTALEDNIVFFRAPSELGEKPVAAGVALRLGGLVREGSVQRDGLNVRFQITDLAHQVDVRFTGMLPDLFREGQGVVAEGRITNGALTAINVLAKHDETYMPREIADSLRDKGVWQGEAD